MFIYAVYKANSKTLSLNPADQRDIQQLNVIKTSENQVKSVRLLRQQEEFFFLFY